MAKEMIPMDILFGITLIAAVCAWCLGTDAYGISHNFDGLFMVVGGVILFNYICWREES